MATLEEDDDDDFQASWHNKLYYECDDFCPMRKFSSVRELQAHKQECSSTRCTHCSVVFDDHVSLDAHLLLLFKTDRVQGQTVNTCPKCRTIFDTQEKRLEHYKHHRDLMGTLVKSEFTKEKGWLTDPVPGRLRITAKHTTCVGGYTYVRGRRDNSKEFSEIGNLGMIAYVFNCEAEGCNARLLVPMRTSNSGDGLTAIRSKLFHNHVPGKNCARVSEVGLLEGSAILEGKQYIKRWTQQNEFDYFECKEPGCVAGLFRLSTNEWLSIASHTCHSIVNEERIEDEFQKVTRLKETYTLNDYAITALSVFVFQPLTPKVIQRMEDAAARSSCVKSACQILQNILVGSLVNGVDKKTKERVFRHLYGLRMSKINANVTSNDEMGLRMMAFELTKDLLTSEGVAFHYAYETLCQAATNGYSSDWRTLWLFYRSTKKNLPKLQDRQLSSTPYIPERTCVMSLKEATVDNLTKCALCNAYALKKYSGRTCRICQMSKYK